MRRQQSFAYRLPALNNPPARYMVAIESLVRSSVHGLRDDGARRNMVVEMCDKCRARCPGLRCCREKTMAKCAVYNRVVRQKRLCGGCNVSIWMSERVSVRLTVFARNVYYGEAKSLDPRDILHLGAVICSKKVDSHAAGVCKVQPCRLKRAARGQVQGVGDILAYSQSVLHPVSLRSRDE